MTTGISSATSAQYFQPFQGVNGPNGNGNNPMDKAMQGVADLLGMTTEDLRSSQQSGTTLAQLAQQKGVSTSDLTSTLAKGLQQNAPSDAPSDIDFSKMATDMINGTGPTQSGGPMGMQGAGGHHHHRHHDSDGQNNASNDLSSLLDQYGINPSELSSLLSSSSSSSSSTSSDSSNSDSSSTDFVAQLKSLISKYGSKGLTYDTSL